MTSFNEEDFQEILEKEGIHDAFLMTNINPPLLQDVALLLQEWKALARYLKLDEPTIKQIQEDNKNDFNEQKYQCLYKWVQLNGKDATLLALLRIIYFRLNDKLLIHQIAQRLRDENKENSKPSTPVKLQSPMNIQSRSPCSKCSRT